MQEAQEVAVHVRLLRLCPCVRRSQSTFAERVCELLEHVRGGDQGDITQGDMFLRPLSPLTRWNSLEEALDAAEQCLGMHLLRLESGGQFARHFPQALDHQLGQLRLIPGGHVGCRRDEKREQGLVYVVAMTHRQDPQDHGVQLLGQCLGRLMVLRRDVHEAA